MPSKKSYANKVGNTYKSTVSRVTVPFDRRVMKPTTGILTRTVGQFPVIGRPLARGPRAVTRAASGLVLAIPGAARTVAKTGFNVMGQVIKAPFEAVGAGGAIAKLGLSSKSRPKKKKVLKRKK